MTVVCVPDERARELVGGVPGVRLVVWDGTSAPPEGLADTEFFVGRYPGGPPQGGLLGVMPALRVVQVLSAGFEAWLDLVDERVTLCNGRGIHGLSTAELAVTLLLAHVRELPRYLSQQARGSWDPGAKESLSDKQVLVMGAGDIGGHVRAVLQALGAEVTLVGRSARDGVVAIQQVPALLPEQDAVVLALPLTEQTTHLVDAKFLSHLRDGAIVVNVGRGATVVTDDLVAELASGRLRAGLDVTDPEPLPAGHPLWSVPNLVLTPHVGGGTPGWERRAYRLVRQQLERFAAGQELANVVRAGTAG